MTNILLSIIVVCKDNPDELCFTLSSLDSLHLSSFLVSCCEIVVVDSSTSDVNLALLSDPSFDHLPIKYYFTPPNGVFGAFNFAITKSFGKYIWFLNSGDSYSFDHNFDVLLDICDRSSSNLLVFKTYVYSSVLGKRLSLLPLPLPAPKQYFTFMVRLFPFWFFPCHQGILFLRSFHLQNLFCSNIALGQDSQLIYKHFPNPLIFSILLYLLFTWVDLRTPFPKFSSVLKLCLQRIRFLQFASAFAYYVAFV